MFAILQSALNTSGGLVVGKKLARSFSSSQSQSAIACLDSSGI